MTRVRPRIAVGGGLLLLTLIGLWAYGFSLQLPFFLDDIEHFRWLEWHSLPSVWRSARPFGYYRPLPFTLWKLLRQLQGRYDPPTLHALNLALHILNACLVWVLVAGRRAKGGVAVGLAAAALFLLFPFSYQAVPWVGSLTHPLVTVLILGSLVLNQLARKHGSRYLKSASLVLALVAPFAHETGTLVAPLLTWLLVTDEEPSPPGRLVQETWPYWACAAFGLAAWLLVPKEPAQLQVFDLEARWQNAVYFLQGLAYPVSPLATRLVGKGGLTDLWAITLVSVPAVALWGLLLRHMGRGRMAALALGWFAILAVPAWAMLPFRYVIDGPRLLYGGSVGAALFWAAPVDVPWPSTRRAIVGRSLAVMAAVAVGLSGYRFIHSRQALYGQMQVAVEGLLAAQPEDPSEPLLCINYPWWIAPFESHYAAGHEGVTLVPEYSTVSALIWLHTGHTRPVEAVVLPDVRQQWDYYYTCAGSIESSESVQSVLRRARQVVVTSYAQGTIGVYEAGGLEAQAMPESASYLAAFGDQIALTGVSWERQGSVARVELRWECRQTPTEELTVFLHLYDEAGRLATQADGYPVKGASRPLFWQPGDRWRDVRRLPLPQDLAPGTYTLKVGLYAVSDGARLAAVGSGGDSLPDDAAPLGTLAIP